MLISFFVNNALTHFLFISILKITSRLIIHKNMKSLFTLNKYPVLTDNRNILNTLTKKHNIISTTHLLTSTDDSTRETFQKYLFITDQGVLIYSTVQIFSDTGRILSAQVDGSLLGKLPTNIPILSVYAFLVEGHSENSQNSNIGLKLKIYFQVPKQKYDFIIIEADLENFQDNFIHEESNYRSSYGDSVRYGSTPMLSNLDVKFETVRFLGWEKYFWPKIFGPT